MTKRADALHSPDGRYSWDGDRWVAKADGRGAGMRSLRAVGCLFMVAVLAFVAFTGSAILVRGDPSAWLPSGFAGSQALRNWAKDLGLIPSSDVGSTLPQPGPRPIIFIPGIMGSILDDANGSETWPQLQSIANCFDANIPLIGDAISLGGFHANASCDQQTLKADAFTPSGASSPQYFIDVANGVEHPIAPNSSASAGTMAQLGGVLGSETATGGGILFGQTKTGHFYDITAENARTSGYTVVHSDGDTGLSVCAGIRKCFVPVGTDWRQSAAFNADRVLSLIQRVLAVTGSDRVDILAHSQGGLVANAIVHQPTSVGKIYRIVTLGTPFLGAPKILAVLLDGACALPVISHVGCPIDSTVIQQLARNYPGVAELDPDAAYFQAYPAAAVMATDSGVSVVPINQVEAVVDSTNPALVQSARSWHAVVDQWGPADPTVGLLRMVGYDATQGAGCDAAPCTAAQVGSYDPNPSSTDSAATVVGVELGAGAQLYYGTGDGTVPLYSASLYSPATGLDDRGSGHDMYWCAVSHIGLAWSTPIWNAAQQFLEGASDDAKDALGIGGSCPGGGTGSLGPLGLVSRP